MIRLGKYIRINPLTPVLFAICIMTGQDKILFISYFTILLHELAHLTAAHFMGLRTDNITMQPFGVNLQLKNKIIYSISDEVILYAAGPAFNIGCALLITVFGGRSDVVRYFYTCNMVLFFINILPVMPLDGGIILKKLITHKFGYKTAEHCLMMTSITITAILIITEIIAAYRSGVNYSVVLMISFLIGNIFTQKEKYDIDFINELMFCDDKKQNNAKVFVIYDDADYRKIAKKFTKGNYGIVLRVNSKGEIEETLTEKQIIDRLME